ncbi:GntR family transcriptional regulator [Mangrovactinospora gilvigrisea]|uniref:GntR family transcriptional regulator n=1 Tax=Mangrovactinospora gilvigrisea TaxID=1428644 RepID=A0A1J7C346_9ACTN|nr:FCD domain-containing protein [Mangrovactinospora gilvigrisea]OIV35988.1 GntR family transcriptional regulator [Mangrovactinospora gilvigrisea]
MTSKALPDRLVGALGPDIVSGRLAAGDVLRLTELEARFAVSRTVVRDAVRRLEGAGLVAARRSVGITVQPAARWDVYHPAVIRWRLADPGARRAQLRSLGELRAAVEPSAAALAARRADPDQCRRLSALGADLTTTARSGDMAAFAGHDREFHTLVLEASGNEMYVRLGEVVEEVLRGRGELRLMPRHPASEAVRLHRAVAEAVCAGEPEDAARAMRGIVDQAMEEIAEDLDARDGAA